MASGTRHGTAGSATAAGSPAGCRHGRTTSNAFDPRPPINGHAAPIKIPRSSRRNSFAEHEIAEQYGHTRKEKRHRPVADTPAPAAGRASPTAGPGRRAPRRISGENAM